MYYEKEIKLDPKNRKLVGRIGLFMGDLSNIAFS